MRTDIVHPGADELTYEIREIVEVGKELEKRGIQINWENIGDPVAKGHKLPAWIKEIIISTIKDGDGAFKYSPTKGLPETRAFLAEMRNSESGVQITDEDILFFNGIGDAISKVYTYLHKSARVIGPNPAYPTHSSAEGAHAGAHHITYDLNPYRNWLPDIEDLRNKVAYNPNVAGILIINPDNPTGMVYPKKVLEEIVVIAKEYDLFVVSDEIYANIVCGDEKMTPISEVLGDVPGLAMKGLSKEIPWPGARCGWIEFYNKDKDPVFARYAKSLVDAKMLEVCSTTLPQKVIPAIFTDKRYKDYLQERAERYKKYADIAYRAFQDIPGIISPKTQGAFYVSVVFEDGVLKEDQKLNIENKKAKEFIESIIDSQSLDKRFVYYLMAATGICTVPLSGFNSDLEGFRVTLLEPDESKFRGMIDSTAKSIKTYLSS